MSGGSSVAVHLPSMVLGYLVNSLGLTGNLCLPTSRTTSSPQLCSCCDEASRGHFSRFTLLRRESEGGGEGGEGGLKKELRSWQIAALDEVQLQCTLRSIGEHAISNVPNQHSSLNNIHTCTCACICNMYMYMCMYLHIHVHAYTCT